MNFLLPALVLVLVVTAGGGFWLMKSCQAIQIVKTHSGNLSFQIVSEKGDSHEPANCGRFPIVAGQE